MLLIPLPLRILWAGPWSLLGLVFALLATTTGGGIRRREATLECWGGWTARLLGNMPLAGGASAMTLGHVILGQTIGVLDRAREHEMVHVRQYERWGPAFIPAYLACSLVLWFRGKDPYFDNPFEREAYGLVD